ncbi:hypothetical protein D8I35_08455 [Corticibacter populi]|uniref:Uncharacterized protein n=1 Tax=Corticibacter populi TaxID=1550736 RepID=A0A3M6QUI5_9BURK|nr:hypothetical protein [Corticibacter populi]RMX06541.1 hypothetical protein D8I35_08455 [Corticibacter populi]
MGLGVVALRRGESINALWLVLCTQAAALITLLDPNPETGFVAQGRIERETPFQPIPGEAA